MDSSATEGSYKVLKIKFAWFSGRVAEMRGSITVNDHKSFTETGLDSLRNSVLQDNLSVMLCSLSPGNIEFSVFLIVVRKD